MRLARSIETIDEQKLRFPRGDLVDIGKNRLEFSFPVDRYRKDTPLGRHANPQR